MPGMISISRRLYVPVLVLAAAGFLSACGGGSSNSTASNTNSNAPASPTATAKAAGGFCALVKQDQSAIQNTDIPTLLASGTPDAWKAYFDKTTTMNQQLVDAAPADIQPDLKTMQANALQLKSTLEAANYDVKQVGPALASLQTPQELAAVQHVVSYVSTQCGIDLTKPAS
jgi:hypothetical protein